MQQESLNQGASGYLKLVLLNLLGIIFGCYVWYLFVGGRKGILVGIGAYMAILSGKLFLRVFGRVQKK